MRRSRTCYDKAHRCPGWAGGGWKSAKVDHCDNGSIRTKGGGYPGENRWRFGYCTKCDTVTWPVVTRWLDPSWLKWAWFQRPRAARFWAELRAVVTFSDLPGDPDF